MREFEEHIGAGFYTENRSVVEGMRQCINYAPLMVLALLVYLGIRSTWIFPGTGLEISLVRSPLWHSGYFGWYDVLLAGSFCLSVLGKSISIGKKNVDFLLVLALVVFLSFINGSRLGWEYLIDACLFLLRFSIVFCLSVQLVRRLGTEAIESFVITVFVILAVSALFVYSLQFGKFNRIYASGMTVASFGQLAAVISFIALFRRYRLLLVVAIIFLLLTFSRTSIIAFVFLTIVFLFRAKRLSFLAKLKHSIPVVLFLIISTFLLIKYGGPEFQFVLNDRLNTKQIATFNNRDSIWENGWYLLRSGYIPLTGVGFNAAPSLFSINSFSFAEDERDLHPASFHSIFLEYGFGLGIFSLIVFYFIFKRIVESFIYHDHMVFFIFTFFLITQALDFTFYRPKEVIVWSLILGLAEGQWRVRRTLLRANSKFLNETSPVTY